MHVHVSSAYSHVFGIDAMQGCPMKVNIHVAEVRQIKITLAS